MRVFSNSYDSGNILEKYTLDVLQTFLIETW